MPYTRQDKSKQGNKEGTGVFSPHTPLPCEKKPMSSTQSYGPKRYLLQLQPLAKISSSGINTGTSPCVSVMEKFNPSFDLGSTALP